MQVNRSIKTININESYLEHPSFKQLFSTEWIKNLREKLIQYLSSIIDDDSQSKLYRVYAMLVKQNGGEQFSFENEDDFSNELSEQINF